MNRTLIQAWASRKSFVPKDGSNDDANRSRPSGRNSQADWEGKRRSNDTHASTSDADAWLFRKSHNTAAVMSFQGRVLMENRSGLVVGAVVTHADGLGERTAALAMFETLPGSHPKTVAADKAYDTRDFVEACRHRRVTPHVGSNNTRIGGSAIDGRTTRHPGYACWRRPKTEPLRSRSARTAASSRASPNFPPRWKHLSIRVTMMNKVIKSSCNSKPRKTRCKRN